MKRVITSPFYPGHRLSDPTPDPGVFRGEGPARNVYFPEQFQVGPWTIVSHTVDRDVLSSFFLSTRIAPLAYTQGSTFLTRRVKGRLSKKSRGLEGREKMDESGLWTPIVEKGGSIKLIFLV